MTTQEPKETKFKVQYHHRYELRSWIRENFPWVEHGFRRNYAPNDLLALERRSSEVLNACSQVEQIDLRNNSAYIEYYANDWRRIKAVVAKKDFAGLADALDDLLCGIDWE
jgi:hypothetical protein